VLAGYFLKVIVGDKSSMGSMGSMGTQGIDPAVLEKIQSGNFNVAGEHEEEDDEKDEL